ncbi:MAG: aminoacyl-tRNA hydrolase [Planctomycetota bacterium]
MKVVLGIGNPGRKYTATRHNVGFRVVDRLAASLGTDVRKRRLKGLLGEGSSGGERLLLVKPQTFVNLSGECARAVIDYYGAGIDSLLVVTDDVNLPLGRLRCRRGGSSGGHNGLDSVIQHLGTKDFARLRVGVGRPERGPEDELVGHVLGRFSEDERHVADEAEARAAEAVLVWAESGVEECQNRFNRPEDPAGSQGAAGGPPDGEKEKP